MRIVLAPNAFKGSLSPSQVANAMKEGILRANPEIQILLAPLSDGGDGFLEVINHRNTFEKQNYQIPNARFKKINVPILKHLSQPQVVIESAKVLGLTLLEASERNPLYTSSWGLGELLQKILEENPLEELILGLGGSATCDGGIGMASALGVRFLDTQGNSIEPIGRELVRLAKIDCSAIHPKLKRLKRILVCCDVANPLLGLEGSAPVYAPQKGADAEAVQLLEQGLTRLAEVLSKDLGKTVHALPFGGSAGGLAAAFSAFFDAQLVSGVEFVMQSISLHEHLKNATLVLTGEGALDAQTFFGKVPVEVAKRAKEANIPCLGIAGQIRGDFKDFHQAGFQAVFSICPYPLSPQESIQHAKTFLTNATEQIIRTFLIGYTQASVHSNVSSSP